MVELSIILDKFPGKRDVLVELARVLNGHGKDAYISRNTLLEILSKEDDPESFIDVLDDEGVLEKLEVLKTCCESPFVDIDYCFTCGKNNEFEMVEYHKILKVIEFFDGWRKNFQEQLSHKIPASDLEFVNLICSQVKSLERNPVIPEGERLKEKQYQFIGYRILSHLFETEMECLTEDGRSDLKFKKPEERIDFVGEYKIWSRRSKNDIVVDQCLNYFNSDTESAFIFMINDLKKTAIWDDYLKEQVKKSESFISQDSLGYLLTRDKFGINVFHSVHFCNTTQKKASIYHFIYDLHGNFGGR